MSSQSFLGIQNHSTRKTRQNSPNKKRHKKEQIQWQRSLAKKCRIRVLSNQDRTNQQLHLLTVLFAALMSVSQHEQHVHKSFHSINFRFTDLWLCCLPCFSCLRLASQLCKILARSMIVNGFPSICSSHDSLFGTSWFTSQSCKSNRASSTAFRANLNWLTAPSASGLARLVCSIALTRPFRSWVTWWCNRFTEHGNGFCLGPPFSVLIDKEREYMLATFEHKNGSSFGAPRQTDNNSKAVRGGVERKFRRKRGF